MLADRPQETQQVTICTAISCIFPVNHWKIDADLFETAQTVLEAPEVHLFALVFDQ